MKHRPPWSTSASGTPRTRTSDGHAPRDGSSRTGVLDPWRGVRASYRQLPRALEPSEALSRACKHSRSAVDVGAVRDAHHPDQDLVIMNRVEDSVLAPAGGLVGLEIQPQGRADSARIGGERPEQEVDDGAGDRFVGRVRWRACRRGKDEGEAPRSAHRRRAASAARTSLRRRPRRRSSGATGYTPRTELAIGVPDGRAGSVRHIYCGPLEYIASKRTRG